MLAKFVSPASQYQGKSYNRDYNIELHIGSTLIRVNVADTQLPGPFTIQIREGVSRFEDVIVAESPELMPDSQGIIEHRFDLEALGLNGVFLLTTGGCNCYPTAVVFGTTAPAGQWAPNYTAFYEGEYRWGDSRQPGYTYEKIPDMPLDLSANIVQTAMPPAGAIPPASWDRDQLYVDNIHLGITEGELDRQWYSMAMADGSEQLLILPGQLYQGTWPADKRVPDYWRCGPSGVATFSSTTCICPVAGDRLVLVDPTGRIGLQDITTGAMQTLLGFRIVPGRAAPTESFKDVIFPGMTEDETRAAIDAHRSECVEHVGSIQGPGGPELINPFGCCRDPLSDDHVFISDEHRIIRLSLEDGSAAVVAGSAELGYIDGAGLDARFERIKSLTYSPYYNGILVCDDRNGALRFFDPGDYSVTTAVKSAWGDAEIMGAIPVFSGGNMLSGITAEERRVQCSGPFGAAKFGHVIDVQHINDDEAVMGCHHDASLYLVNFATKYVQHLYQWLPDQNMRNAGKNHYPSIAIDRDGALGEAGIIVFGYFEDDKVARMATHADGKPTLKIVHPRLFKNIGERNAKAGILTQCDGSGYPVSCDFDHERGWLYMGSASGMGAYRVRARTSIDGEAPDYDLYFAGQMAWTNMIEGKQSLLGQVGPYGCNRLGAPGLPQYMSLDSDGRRAMIEGVWGRPDLLDRFNAIDYYLDVVLHRGFEPGTATPYIIGSTEPPIDPPVEPPVDPPEPPAEPNMVEVPQDEIIGLVLRLNKLSDRAKGWL